MRKLFIFLFLFAAVASLQARGVKKIWDTTAMSVSEDTSSAVSVPSGFELTALVAPASVGDTLWFLVENGNDSFVFLDNDSTCVVISDSTSAAAQPITDFPWTEFKLMLNDTVKTAGATFRFLFEEIR